MTMAQYNKVNNRKKMNDKTNGRKNMKFNAFIWQRQQQQFDDNQISNVTGINININKCI